MLETTCDFEEGKAARKTCKLPEDFAAFHCFLEYFGAI